MRNTITGLVHHSVVFDHGIYGNALTAAATGMIDSCAEGGNGVYLNAASAQGNLLNLGTIIAGLGASAIHKGAQTVSAWPSRHSGR